MTDTLRIHDETLLLATRAEFPSLENGKGIHLISHSLGAMRLPGPVIRSTTGDQVRKRLIHSRSEIIRAMRRAWGSET